MGVSSCMSLRQARGSCHCPACPRASGHGAPMPPQTLVLPPMALEPETTPVKDKKGSKMKVLKKIKKKIGLGKLWKAFVFFSLFSESCVLAFVKCSFF